MRNLNINLIFILNNLKPTSNDFYSNKWVNRVKLFKNNVHNLLKFNYKKHKHLNKTFFNKRRKLTYKIYNHVFRNYFNKGFLLEQFYANFLKNFKNYKKLNKIFCKKKIIYIKKKSSLDRLFKGKHSFNLIKRQIVLRNLFRKSKIFNPSLVITSNVEYLKKRNLIFKTNYNKFFNFFFKQSLKSFYSSVYFNNSIVVDYNSKLYTLYSTRNLFFRNYNKRLLTKNLINIPLNYIYFFNKYKYFLNKYRSFYNSYLLKKNNNKIFIAFFNKNYNRNKLLKFKTSKSFYSIPFKSQKSIFNNFVDVVEDDEDEDENINEDKSVVNYIDYINEKNKLNLDYHFSILKKFKFYKKYKYNLSSYLKYKNVRYHLPGLYYSRFFDLKVNHMVYIKNKYKLKSFFNLYLNNLKKNNRTKYSRIFSVPLMNMFSKNSNYIDKQIFNHVSKDQLFITFLKVFKNIKNFIYESGKNKVKNFSKNWLYSLNKNKKITKLFLRNNLNINTLNNNFDISEVNKLFFIKITKLLNFDLSFIKQFLLKFNRRLFIYVIKYLLLKKNFNILAEKYKVEKKFINSSIIVKDVRYNKFLKYFNSLNLNPNLMNFKSDLLLNNKVKILRNLNYNLSDSNYKVHLFIIYFNILLKYRLTHKQQKLKLRLLLLAFKFQKYFLLKLKKDNHYKYQLNFKQNRDIKVKHLSNYVILSKVKSWKRTNWRALLLKFKNAEYFFMRFKYNQFKSKSNSQKNWYVQFRVRLKLKLLGSTYYYLSFFFKWHLTRLLFKNSLNSIFVRFNILLEPSAFYITKYICNYLKKGLKLNQIINSLIYDIPKLYPNILAVQVKCVGRHTRKERASRNWFRKGSLRSSNINAKVDYASNGVILKYGYTNIKVWLLKIEKMSSDSLGLKTSFI